MNRINDKGDYLFVLRSFFFSLFHFLWFKFKKLIQEVFCENGAFKFPKKQIQASKNVYEVLVKIEFLCKPVVRILTTKLPTSC